MSNGTIVRTGSVLVSLAAFVVIVAGMKAAAPLLVPFLLALFITVIIASPFGWLRRRGVPAALALLLVISVFVGVVVSIGTLIGGSVEDFSRTYPAYQTRLHETTTHLIHWLDDRGIVIPNEPVTRFLDPGKAMRLASIMLSSMGGMLTDGFLILITVIFLLLEASSFPDKWRAAHSNADESLARFYTVTQDINHYMGIKTLTSLATGVLVAIWLAVLGVDYPALWGVLAFLLNYVPNIGSIIAAIPAVLLALVQLGVSQALLVAAGYMVVNIVIGTFAEPRLMGQGLGLSTLVVFLSLILWGWVLGPVGMLLSVPLTIAAKIALDSNEGTRWMAVMLGPRIIAVPEAADPAGPAGSENSR